MRGGRLALLAAAVALAVSLAGCGGGYTRRDFIARADAICTDALRQARSIAPGTALPTYLAHFVPVLESEASQLEALRRPPGSARDHALLKRYYAALSQTVRAYQQLAVAARQGDDQGVTNLEAELGSIPLYSLAASYGLASCGTPGSTSA